MITSELAIKRFWCLNYKSEKVGTQLLYFLSMKNPTTTHLQYCHCRVEKTFDIALSQAQNKTFFTSQVTF